MAVKSMEVSFSDGFKGIAKAPNMEISIGTSVNQLLPYDMLYAALASCVYATFLEIVVKKKISYSQCNMRITGEKREEVPTTLKWVNVEFEIVGLEDNKEKGLIKSAELATKYCSIYQTIAKVADMSYEVLFK